MSEGVNATRDVNGELLIGVKPVWESDRYDMPLGGHAWYNGEYGVFNITNFATATGKDEPRYAFSKAKTPADALKLMAERQLFEDMVGHHCTYGIRGGYDPDKAVDFDGFYGRKKPLHPYVELAKSPKAEVEYVGDFIFPA